LEGLLAGADPHREQQLLAGEGGHHGAGRAGPGEDRDQAPDGVLRPGVACGV
jgi:hypothetical protein